MSGYKKRSGITTTSRGKPSKINSYMDKFGDGMKTKYLGKQMSGIGSEGMRYPRGSIDDGPISPGISRAKKDMSMDDSFGSPRTNRANDETDLKNAMKDINEVALVHDEVTIFEKNYYNGKKKINNCDMLTLEADVTSKALSMQY
jgi:hypothetical protein